MVDAVRTAEKTSDVAEMAAKQNCYSGDLMSVEDAARYSEHWKDLGIGSDKTWDEFIKANPDKTIEDYFKLVKE